MPRHVAKRTWLLSLRVVALYATFSIIWIRVSDHFVSSIADDVRQLTWLQTMKGWLWILLTSIFLYAVVARALDSHRRDSQGLSRRDAQLDLVMRQVPAILWVADKDLIITSMMGGGLKAIGRSENEGVGSHVSDRAATPQLKAQVMESAEQALSGQDAAYFAEFDGHAYEAAIAPLRSEEGDIIGVVGLAVDSTEEKRVERELIGSIEDLERSNEQRNRLVRHLVRAEQEERDRIATGIHDDSIQVMTSAGMAIDLLLTKLEDPSSVEIAQRARRFTIDAIRRLRNLVFELRPVELEQDGLGTALRLLLERAGSEGGFAYDIEDHVKSEVPVDVRRILYGIAQEAISNAGKHARASRVDVCLEDADGGIRVIVSDDGRGFDPQLQMPGHHFGLENMQERAELAGGWCRVSSDARTGTRVEFWAPTQAAELKAS